MGSFLDKPKTEKTTTSGEGLGLKYASSAMQGWRMEMEDADICDVGKTLKNHCFFGVFDGHAGSKVSQYTSSHLLDHIVKQLKSAKPDSDGNYEVDDIKKAMEAGFLKLDVDLKSSPPWSTGQDHSGSTAIVVLISPTHIFWGNCGDSRSIFCRKSKLEYGTEDHKPFNEKEKNRIEKAGGTVMMQRVNGTLAVSRALGDFDYKTNSSISATEQLVSPEPDIHVMKRDPDHDEFVLLACDGIFDVMLNEPIVEYIRHRLEVTRDLEKICEDLIDLCLHKNSRDNMSVVLVTFPGAPQVSEEAIEKEKQRQADLFSKLDEALKNMVASAADSLELEENSVMNDLPNHSELKIDWIFENKPTILEKLQKLKQEKFGSRADDNFTVSEHFVGGKDLTMKDGTEFDGYDPQLLDSQGDELDELDKDDEDKRLEDDQMDTEDGNSPTTVPS